MLRKICWFLILPLAFAAAARAQDAIDGVSLLLFNGSDLSGWHEMGPQNWHVENQLLWSEGKGGWLRTEKPYADFILHLDYRVAKGAEGGILLRAPEQGDPVFGGLEIVLKDDAGQPTDLHSSGAIYGAVIPLYSVAKETSEWNQVEISCIGRRLTVYLNGNRIHKIDFDDPAFVFSEKRPLGRVPNQGYIGLESHTNRIDFRNLRIQVLKPAA
jgi:hypothetical protein